MIAAILYFFTVYPFAKMARMYYKSKDGFERIGLIWLNATIAVGLFIRGISYFLPVEFSEIVGIAAIGGILITSYVHCIFLMKKYDHWKIW